MENLNSIKSVIRLARKNPSQFVFMQAWTVLAFAGTAAYLYSLNILFEKLLGATNNYIIILSLLFLFYFVLLIPILTYFSRNIFLCALSLLKKKTGLKFSSLVLSNYAIGFLFLLAIGLWAFLVWAVSNKWIILLIGICGLAAILLFFYFLMIRAHISSASEKGIQNAGEQTLANWKSELILSIIGIGAILAVSTLLWLLLFFGIISLQIMQALLAILIAIIFLLWNALCIINIARNRSLK